jgi:hypothetical protein
MGAAAIDAAKLAEALAERLEPIVPAEFEVTAAGASIRLARRGAQLWSEKDLRWMLEDGEREEQVCFAVWNTLDDFQDFVARELTEPWPAASPGPMPEPFAQIVDGHVVAGYGDPQDPFVRLQPMRLRDL